MRRFIEDFCLTPDHNPAPFGAFAPNAAQAAIISLAHRTRLKRGAFRPWLSRLVNLLRDGPVDVRYQDASFRFYHQASATERGALFNPAYNIEELDFLRAHVPPGGVFVDVGANVGTYALALARHVGAGGKVIAIEPHPVTLARLAFNNAASGTTQVPGFLWKLERTWILTPWFMPSSTLRICSTLAPSEASSSISS